MDVGKLVEGSTELARQDSLRLANLNESFGGTVREQSLTDYWRILQKRKWTVVVSVVVVFIMAGLISVRMIPIYDASTRIMISQRPANPLNFKDNQFTQGSVDLQADIDTQVKILQSDTLAESVIHRLNLDTRPEFAGKATIQSSGGIAVSESPAQERA